MKAPKQTKGIRVVAPFRPFPPESDLHQELAARAFDWVAAIQMLFHSVRLACQCPVHIVTDARTDLPVPSLKYTTTHRRLMLWTLEACLRYLESADFDRDTVMLDCDQLVYRDLARFFTPGVDLGVLVRPTAKHASRKVGDGMPLLNGVQFWAHAGKERLVAFYQKAIEVAATLSEDLLRWGADQEAVLALLRPMSGPGLTTRTGVKVRFINYEEVLEALSTDQIRWLREGRMPFPSRAVLDFRWKRKQFMGDVYRATILAGAVIE